MYTFCVIAGMENDDSAVQYAIGRSDTVAPGVGIDLEFDADVQTMSPEASEYETCYVTSHKGPCRVATYSRDGQLIATGSADASIKILDTERMLAKSAMPLEVSTKDVQQIINQADGAIFSPQKVLKIVLNYCGKLLLLKIVLKFKYPLSVHVTIALSIANLMM